MNYLLDSNTFIEAKNRYYHMTICPGYWDWLTKKFHTGDISSIQIVGDELLKGNDELAAWASNHPEIFVPVSDQDTQQRFVEIAEYVASLANMKPGAIEDFLDGADPWLIAKAKCNNSVVVTHEQFHPDVKKKVLIPNICKQFDVPYMDTFELLHKLEAEFVLAPEE